LIYPEHIQEEVFKYYKLAGINIEKGIVSSIQAEEIKKFINYKLKVDRNKTRAIKYQRSFEINDELQKIKNKFESPIEEYLYAAFIENGLDKHCRPQFEIGTKRVDFAFPIAKLAVECDGKRYHFTEKSQIEHDQKRDKYLARRGWRVLHIEGLAIRRNIDLCIKKVKENLVPFIIN